MVISSGKGVRSDFRDRSQHYWCWVAILALAAGLRIWGPLGDPGIRHPDEFFLVYWPLYFSTGDFNHQHTLTAFYPAFHYYLLAAFYFLYFGLLKLGGLAWSMDQWVAHQFFWGGDELVRIGRWTSVVFALVTVWWAGCVGRQVWGLRAGRVAALCTAVCSIHVRQSGLVAVDVPMTCWYIGVVWAALRLMDREDIPAYLWAGLLVGWAAAAKYPGVLSCGAVVVAHFGAGRGICDRRLWLSSVAAVGSFFVATPYTLLDFEVFAGHFSSELDHLQTGHGGQQMDLGWWYYPSVVLPAGLGWLGLVLAAGGAAVAWLDARGRVLLAAFAGYYLVMGAGQLVFVRYALPLLVLGAILVGGAIGRVGRPWCYALLLLGLAEPLYSSVRVVQLHLGGDTRSEARQWMETQLPSGSICCNFGGWAGDVPVWTVEGLQGRIYHYERLWGRERLDALREFILESGPRGPFYSYAINLGNNRYEPGSAEIVEHFACPYVILHRHQLSYSRIDTGFAKDLAARGELLVRFTPGDDAGTRYDPIDAYYWPIGPFGALRQSGPEIEIWRVGVDAPARWKDLPQALAKAYAVLGLAQLEAGELADASALVERALYVDADCADGFRVAARIMERLGRDREAHDFFKRLIALEPDWAANWVELGNLYRRQGEEDTALRCYARALELDPDYSDAAALRRTVEGDAGED